MNTSIRSITLAGAIATAIALSACSGAAPATQAPAPKAAEPTKAAAPVELKVTVWTSNETQLKTLADIGEAYRKNRPNVTVKYESIPIVDYVSKVTIQLSSATPPDVGWVVESSAPTFVNAGVLADLRPTLDKTAGYNYADLSKPAMGLWTKANAVYGVPFSSSPFFVVYNKDMFAAAGAQTPEDYVKAGTWTWENLAKASADVQKKLPAGSYGFQTIDGAGFTSPWATIVPIIRSFGGDAWTADNICGLDKPEAVKAVQLFHNMVYKDKSVVPPGEQADFYAGKAAMTTAQLSRLSKLEKAEFKWGMVPLPGNAQIIGQAAFAVWNASKNKDEALNFLAFMTNPENTALTAQYFPPARSSVLNGTAWLASNKLVTPDQMKASVVSGIEKGTVLPSHPSFPKIDLIARAEFDKLWKADANAQQILTGMCEMLKPVLAAR